MKKIIPTAAVCALALTGCTQQGFEAGLNKFSAGLITFNASVARYAPVIGKDLLMIGGDIVLAECSPLAPVFGQAVNNVVLKVTAPSSRVAARVSDLLAGNAAVAQQLCPLVTAIQAQVGAVPRGLPSQAVAVPPG